jgi:hypothetical protein
MLRLVYGEKLGLVWRNRKKMSQIIKGYLYLPFFLLFLLCIEGLYYTKSTRVSVPSSELAPPAPSPTSECVPPGTKGEGGNTHLWARGGGANSDNWRKSAWHYEYSVLDTYIAYCTENESVVFFSTKNAAKNCADMLTFQEKCKTFHM